MKPIAIALFIVNLIVACVDQPPQPCGDAPKRPTLRFFPIDEDTIGISGPEYRNLDAYFEHLDIYLACIGDQ